MQTSRFFRMIISLTAIVLISASGAACLTPQETQYETTDSNIEVPQAPPGTRRVKIALINFRNQTGRNFLVDPATAQLTSLMVSSGYFEVIEPSLVESVIQTQSDITPEKLQILKERYGAEYFLTGTLTNFEVQEKSQGSCLFLIGSHRKSEYIVETAIDYRLVSVPDAGIVAANAVENRRVDTSEAAGVFIYHTG
ncbi:MAG: hypothetical protein KDK27_02875, partial [Leptospiraceae bacterium]|nr:hypothetical protein [Leptospiraceae bacterium]